MDRQARQSYLQSLKFAVGGILGRGHWGQWIYPMILYTVAAQDDSIHCVAEKFLPSR